MLGWFYYKTGRYDLSALHLLYAIIYKVSEVNTVAVEKDPDYQFSTFESLIQYLPSHSSVDQFLSSSDVYSDLYYLAGSSFAKGYPSHAFSIWRVLSRADHAGKYIDLSSRQLKSPWLEPYLKISSAKKE